MELERQYVLDSSPGKQELWARKQQEYKAVITRNAENRRLFQRQRCFEEGERVGRMLALLASTNSPSSTISMIRTPSGEISSDPVMIKETFFDFYRVLCKSKWDIERGELDKFLEGVELPTLSAIDKTSLESPITLEELKSAVTDMPNHKSPGPDGLPLSSISIMGRCCSLPF